MQMKFRFILEIEYGKPTKQSMSEKITCFYTSQSLVDYNTKYNYQWE